ncbi:MULTISPECIES: sugar ABC transporter substrate-binding protein [Streptomyces]|uniref:Sugar ABC transporter n=2 Tax=Streptomyces TaxID=1883 RepID=A0A2U9NVY6_STRAS|nr:MULTISPECIES: sugar ABC transporter substrate-binding protein [Streptomyces]AWT41453.1 sugar ABC transporter [Streptomyces actuosus]MBM4825983.1 sugar ABC transporter substrate-binding protein [Streptomyces actuosus]GHF55031.1 sugar ABC transporter substrate-binding protein [Streptomyces griseosporeus]
MSRTPRLPSALLRAAACTGLAALTLTACGSGAGTGTAGSGSGSVKVGLITKTDTNPFFVKMKEGAEKAAKEDGVQLMTAAGKFDGDNAGQVTAIENMVAAGVKGILITPSDSKAIVPAIEKAKAKGVLVIALDTPTEPQSAVDALFATDNLRAGELIGEYAKAAMKGKAAKIATLDLAPGVSVGVQRHNGFLKGFGVKDGDASVVCSQDTGGDQAKGQTAMENCLQKEPGINVVYTINEPAALGAYTALKAKGREKDVLIVSVDGGCTGTRAVKDGRIAATSQQYPLKMAAEGVKAVVTYAKGGKKASGYTDTGVTLVTDRAQPGLTSKDTNYGLDNCWG